MRPDTWVHSALVQRGRVSPPPHLTSPPVPRFILTILVKCFARPESERGHPGGGTSTRCIPNLRRAVQEDPSIPTRPSPGACRNEMTLGVTAGAAPSLGSSLPALQNRGGDEPPVPAGPCSAVRAPAVSPAPRRRGRAGKRVSVCGSQYACNVVLRDPPYTHHLNYLISPNCCTFINH